MIFAKLVRLIAAHADSSGAPPSVLILCDEWFDELMIALKAQPGDVLELFHGIPVRRFTEEEKEQNKGMRALTRR